MEERSLMPIMSVSVEGDADRTTGWAWIRGMCAVFGVLLLAVFLTTPAVAERKGTFSAVVFASLPADAGYEVRVMDDSGENLTLRDNLIAFLRAQGARIGVGAAYRITLEAGNEIGIWANSGHDTVLRFGNPEVMTATDEPGMRVNLFDTRNKGLLRLSQERQFGEVAPGRFHNLAHHRGPARRRHRVARRIERSPGGQKQPNPGAEHAPALGRKHRPEHPLAKFPHQMNARHRVAITNAATGWR